jgi:hypothetical protein
VDEASRTEANLHFRQGVALFKEQSFAAALVEFRKAYRVLPDWRVLYDIGMTQLELKDDAGAITALEQYLREASGISDSRRSEVKAEVDRLRLRVGTLGISVNREGAEVTIDDVSVGKAPLAQAVVVNIGRRRVVAMLPDGRQTSRLVDVAAKESVQVDLLLEEEGPSKVEAPPPPVLPAPAPSVATAPLPEAPPPVHRPDYLWLGVTASGALVAGGVVTGLLALKAKTDADNDIARPGLDRSALQNANSQMHTWAAVSDALFASAAVAGGVTLYFALRHTAVPASASAGAWSALLTPGRVSLQGEF